MLETDRILLRPIEAGDNTQVFGYRSDAETNKYQGFVPTELAEVDAFIGKNPAEFNQSESWFQLVIVDKASNQVVGDIGVHFIADDGHQVELGCTLSKKHQGKGLATEAMKAVIGHLFNSLNKHRITGSVDPRNVSSLRMLDRLGFRKEAHFKQSLFIDGEWVDDIVYGLLSSEWND